MSLPFVAARDETVPNLLNADQGIEPPPEAALDHVGPLPDVGEPEGLRRTDRGLARPRDAGGDHNGAPLRQERNRCGGSGAKPPSVRCSAAGGSKGGAASPRQSPVYAHWVGWPTGQSGQPTLAVSPAVLALVTTVTRAHGGLLLWSCRPPTALVIPRHPSRYRRELGAHWNRDR